MLGGSPSLSETTKRTGCGLDLEQRVKARVRLAQREVERGRLERPDVR